MTLSRTVAGASISDMPAASDSGGLFRKYVSLFVVVVCLSLIGSSAFEMWFSYVEQVSVIVRLEREQAVAVAAQIEHFIKDIKSRVEWTTQLPVTSDDLEYRRVELVR